MLAVGLRLVRHDHQIGLLEPVDVGRATGYRRYSTDLRVPLSSVIRPRPTVSGVSSRESLLSRAITATHEGVRRPFVLRGDA